MHMGKRETANPNSPMLVSLPPHYTHSLIHIRPFPPQLGSPAVSNLHGLAERFNVVRCCCFSSHLGDGGWGLRTYMRPPSLALCEDPIACRARVCFAGYQRRCRRDVIQSRCGDMELAIFSGVLPTISTKLSYRVRVHAARIPPS